MFGIVLLLFLVVPLVELYIIVEVQSSIGLAETIFLLIAVSVLGAWLVRREGLGVIGRVQAELAQGRIPGGALVDGLLILVAGALMLTPGFMTDGLGLVLLLPFTRAGVRALLVRRFRHRIGLGRAGFVVFGDGRGPRRPGARDGDVIDGDVIDGDVVDVVDERDDPPDRPPYGLGS